MSASVIGATSISATRNHQSFGGTGRLFTEVSPAGQYTRQKGRITRRIQLRDGSSWSSDIADRARLSLSPYDAFDQSWLRSPTAPDSPAHRGVVRAIDLFSGCGGLSLGLWEACRAVGKRMEAIAAVDNNASAVSAYVENFGGRGLAESVDELAQGAGLKPATAAERSLAQQLGDVDFMLAGPPCQGHSDLNNHTRRSDPKNRLYLAAARFAVVLRPRNIVIENVPGVVHDHRNWSGLRGRSSDRSVTPSAVRLWMLRRLALLNVDVGISPLHRWSGA